MACLLLTLYFRCVGVQNHFFLSFSIWVDAKKIFQGYVRKGRKTPVNQSVGKDESGGSDQ